MCFLLMEIDKLGDPRRIEYVEGTVGGTKSLAPDVSKRVITVKHVAIHLYRIEFDPNG